MHLTVGPRLVGLIIAALALTLAVPSARADDGAVDDPTCAEGYTLSPAGDVCSKTADPFQLALCPQGFVADATGPCTRAEAAEVTTDACPVDAFGPVGACYVIVPKGAVPDPVCELGGGLVAGECVLIGAPPTANGCAPGFTLEGNDCVQRYVPISISAQCPVNSLEHFSGECRQAVAVVPGGSFACADAAASLLGDQCVFTAGFIRFGTCTDDTGPVAAASGTCELSTPATEIGPSCPVGSLGSAGTCYMTVDRIEFSGCFEAFAVFVVDTCIITGSPPVLIAGTLSCSPGFTILEDTCLRYESALGDPNPRCPDGADDTAGECRIPVADSAATLRCEDPSTVLSRTRCVQTGAATVFCSPGFTLSGSECRTDTEPSGGISRAAAVAYPGPFQNVPMGPVPSLLDAPDIALPHAAAEPAQAGQVIGSTTSSPALAHTGSTSTSIAIVGLALLGAGAGATAIGRVRTPLLTTR